MPTDLPSLDPTSICGVGRAANALATDDAANAAADAASPASDAAAAVPSSAAAGGATIGGATNPEGSTMEPDSDERVWRKVPLESADHQHNANATADAHATADALDADSSGERVWRKVLYLRQPFDDTHTGPRGAVEPDTLDSRGQCESDPASESPRVWRKVPSESPDDASGERVWRKVLYLRQPFDDTHTDPRTFLADMRTNAGVVKPRYWSLVRDSSVLTLQMPLVSSPPWWSSRSSSLLSFETSQNSLSLAALVLLSDVPLVFLGPHRLSAVRPPHTSHMLISPPNPLFPDVPTLCLCTVKGPLCLFPQQRAPVPLPATEGPCASSRNRGPLCLFPQQRAPVPLPATEGPCASSRNRGPLCLFPQQRAPVPLPATEGPCASSRNRGPLCLFPQQRAPVPLPATEGPCASSRNRGPLCLFPQQRAPVPLPATEGPCASSRNRGPLCLFPQQRAPVPLPATEGPCASSRNRGPLCPGGVSSTSFSTPTSSPFMLFSFHFSSHPQMFLVSALVVVYLFLDSHRLSA
ncbi:unnamed protein product [Closterium sp. Yama58-4]|nr:unnamed protein product [Closterium sp. Yama58-4]